MHHGRICRRFLVVIGVLCVASSTRAQTKQPLEQVVGVLDYVGADYAGAVSENGTVLSQAEFTEQEELLTDALRLTKQAGLRDSDPSVQGLHALVADLQRHASPSAVRNTARTIREQLVRDHNVVTAPAQSPDFARGAELYAQQGCSNCHGATGDAQTPVARTLTPPPANFLSEERMLDVSAHRAFSAISFGVRGTAMTAYDRLSAHDRWNLAYYVLSLRHKSGDLRRGERVVHGMAGTIHANAKGVSQLTDRELLDLMGNVAAQDRQAALAYIRAKASFRSGENATFDLARTELDRGLAAYQRGDAQSAQTAFVSAYLDGFEPHEAALRARKPALVAQVEKQMLALRVASQTANQEPEVQKRVATVLALLRDAEERDGATPSAAFLSSMAIALREGFEAALLIAALLALVRKRGLAEHAKYIHLGWTSAIVAGIGTWWAVGSALGGLERELSEGIIAIVAAFVLLGVTHWLVGQATAKRWMGFLAKNFDSQMSGGKTAWAVASLAFVAAYREAFEVVLFYKALVLDAPDSVGLIVLGVVAGIAGLALVVWLLKRIGQRLQPRPFMLASSALLALLAVVFIGKGTHSLQEAGFVGITPISIPEVSALGFFSTVETAVAQGVLILLLAASALVPWWTSRKESTPPPPNGAAAKS